MKRNEFNQSVSVTVFLHDKPRKDGKQTVYLRVIIERRKREFNLREGWPVKFFNKDQQKALPRYRDDKDVERVNYVINEAIGRSNKIKLRYFADNRKLTLDLFEKEFVDYLSADNFMHYWNLKRVQQEADGIIQGNTATSHRSAYRRMAAFLGGKEYLSFADIDLNLIQKFNAWMRNTRKLGHNSCCATHKILKTYLNHALDDKKRFENPYAKFKFSFRDGTRDVLDKDELERLKNVYLQGELEGIAREVLRKFIFSCYTGIRISDSGLVTSDMIRDGKLYLATKKGLNFGKQVHIKLPDFALQLVAGRKGLLFESIADATCNRFLKVIAVLARIKKKLSFHVSRDTFATHYISMGGNVYHLMLLMGHSDMRTTMIYVKLSAKETDEEMNNFNLRDQGKLNRPGVGPGDQL